MKKRLFWSLALVATSFVALGGCQRGTDEESARQAEEVEQATAPKVNYSLAEPLELKQIKSEKEFVEFCQKSEIAVVKFGADWCGPCRQLIPELQKMAGYFQTEGVQIAEVDVEDVPELSNELHISGIPATFVYYRGNFYSAVEGNVPDSIASLVDSICQKEAQNNENQTGAKSTGDAPLTLEDELWSEEDNKEEASVPEIANETIDVPSAEESAAPSATDAATEPEETDAVEN